MKKIIFTVLLSICGTVASYAQSSSNGCDTTIWLVNIYPGPEIYELEGHTALRIKTCEMDVAVNYGMFNFDSPNFVYRFVKGETDYMVGALPWQLFMSQYTGSGRRIVAHRLNLDKTQKTKLLELVKENVLPQNCVYRYNYVLDNCATRPVRIIERAAGDTLMFTMSDNVPDLSSFREYMRHYHRNYPWYQFGIDIALGKGIDREIDDREKTFAPVILDGLIDKVTIGEGSGKKLVAETEVWFDSRPDAAVLEGTPWFLTPAFISWLLFAFVLIYCLHKSVVKGQYPRLVASTLFLIYGLTGLLVTFLVFVSVHESTSPNLNLLWLNPLCFVPVVCQWINKAVKINIVYFLLNFVLLLAVILLWIVGYQSPNAAFIPLVLTDLCLSFFFLYLYLPISGKKKTLH